MSTPSGAHTWVDRGGTFTDVVSWTPGEAPTARKVRSDSAVVGRLARGELVFGTTVATNALLEGRGVRTLLVVTHGLGDLPRLRHMARPSLFDPDADWPAPLFDRVLEVEGRIDARGQEVIPLRLPAAWPMDGIDAVAIALMHSHLCPDHELRIAEAIRAANPHVFVSLGHLASPDVGYLARVETTLLDAAVTPILLSAMTQDEIPDDAWAIRSDGGLVHAPALRAPDAVLSGPSGGVLAVSEVARMAGFDGAVGLDMGGTSTDVCCVVGHQPPRRQGDVDVAGVVLRRPMLEVHTIAAGGGSVLWSDGIRLRVGPRSAGADPGPQCYGRGGPPTLTDAACALGLVDPEAFAPPLRADLVDLPDEASAFVDVAREAMAAAVRKVATARGVDLRRLALVSYGGAAGAHAADVAQRLGIRTVLVHPFASVLSAWGQTLARPSTEHLHTLWKPLEEAWTDIATRVRSAQLPSTDHEVVAREFLLGLRPPGTDHTLEIPVTSAHQIEDVRAAHRERHHEQFGFDREDETLEAVSLRERLWGPVRDLPPLPSDPWSLDGDTVTGPARLDCPTTSIWVPSGWTARQRKGLLWLEHQAPEMVAKDCFRTRQGVALWSSRFMAVATNAGEVLRRLARSVNIRERLDFSCAVFDDEGRLVANAPHIPVHLGAMGETVRDLLQAGVPLEDGSAWLTNDPNAGGSHLPDLTVVTPVVHGDRRWFVASRGHHVDVGGTTPGSMPPHSTRLDQEGVVFRREAVVCGDQFQRLDLAARGCRQPEVVRADLEAQVAANLHAAQALRALGPAEVVQQWMTHLQDAASEAVGGAVSAWPEGHAEDILGGVPLRVSVRSQDGLLIVDFDGTGGPHVGNLNAPRAVVRAAVLYVLRVLVGDEIPLNEGALDAVDVRIPSPSILSPPPGAAVAGGNVETSQRVVDLLMRAMGLRAGAQGTMNNLTLGGEGWSLYETVGGGQGASPSGPGRSGGQVHMTNTRATDPEVLETRLPLRLVTFSVRRGSGGTGHHPGGDGVVRTLQVLAPATAALLATRRERGAAGLEGGAEGAPGRDRVHRAGGWASWDGSPISLSPGDRVEVSTPGGGGWRPA